MPTSSRIPTQREWRDFVLRFHRAGMNEGTRVLLLVLADHMDGRRYVSVPRSRLAELLAVAPARISERLLVAKELGLLDVVSKGRKGSTAVYQGLFPIGTHVRTKSRRPNALSMGTGLRTHGEAVIGTHVPDASSKRSAAEAFVSPPAETKDPVDGLALAPTALGRGAAEDQECGRLPSTDRSSPIPIPESEALPPGDLPDDWEPNAQHRVSMSQRNLDPVEVVEAFRATYAAVFERRRNWDTTFARFVADYDEDWAVHWAVA